MSLRFRQRLARLRGFVSRDESPRLSDESRWYTEHTALLISTLKWALLGAAAGVCVGLGTRVFLSVLDRSAAWARALTLGRFPAFVFLPVALPLCVWLIRTFSPDARGHGTEAVIAAVHQRSGRVDWLVAPIKLGATVVTLAFGGSVGKEGPAAQIGAALTSLFADILRLRDEDRCRLVICGISAGFAAVFGTPVSGSVRVVVPVRRARLFFRARLSLREDLDRAIPRHAGELPRFLAAIWRVFNEYELAGYVAMQKPIVQRQLRALLYFS